jgi:hypothetical protein
LKIDSVDQKFNGLECGNFSQDAGTPGNERVIAFSQLAVKGLMNFEGLGANRAKGLREVAYTAFPHPSPFIIIMHNLTSA